MRAFHFFLMIFFASFQFVVHTYGQGDDDDQGKIMPLFLVERDFVFGYKDCVWKDHPYSLECLFTNNLTESPLEMNSRSANHFYDSEIQFKTSAPHYTPVNSGCRTFSASAIAHQARVAVAKIDAGDDLEKAKACIFKGMKEIARKQGHATAESDNPIVRLSAYVQTPFKY